MQAKIQTSAQSFPHDDEEQLAKDYLKKARSFQFISSDSAKFYSNQAYSVASKNNLTSIAGKAVRELGYIYYDLGNYEASRMFINRSMEMFKEVDSLHLVALDYEWLGNIDFKLTRTDQAMANYVRSMEIYDNIGYEDRKTAAFLNFGKVYMQKNDFEKALENFLTVKKLFEGRQEDMTTVRLYINLGISYLQLDSVPKSEESFKQALQISEDINSQSGMLTTLYNMAYLNTKKEQYDKALQDYMGIAAKCQEIGKISTLAKSYGEIGDILGVLGRYDEALAYYFKSLALLEELNDLYWTESLYGQLSTLYASLNNPDESLRYKTLQQSLADSINQIQQSNQLAQLEAVMEFKRMELEIEKEKKEKRIKELTNYWLITLSVAFVLIFGLVLFLLHRKRKREKKLLQKDKDLMVSKLAQSKLEEEKLKLEINFKENQLSAHALNIMQKNDLLNELKQKVNNYEVSKENSEKFKKICYAVNNNLGTKKDWEYFTKYFDQINPDFILKLKKRAPNLTNTELRFCALIKQNYGQKEICSILNLSPNTIKSSRFRIRKKLPISSNQTLDDFIRQI